MIVVVNADGTAGVAVANGVDPSWSREGHIAFNSEECGPVDFFVFCFYEGIRILLADGTLSELVGTGVNPAWRR